LLRRHRHAYDQQTLFTVLPNGGRTAESSDRTQANQNCKPSGSTIQRALTYENTHKMQLVQKIPSQ